MILLRSCALVLIIGLVAGRPALTAQPAPAAPQAALRPDAPLPDRFAADTYRLWPGRAPNAGSDGAAETPTLTVFRPQFARVNAPAVVIAPGGGYVGLAWQLEGVEPAAWFTSRGVTAFVLTYRVGAAARLPAPLLDGARAIRFVRAHAAELHIDANRVGMMGFSAGGHLAATTAVDATPGQPGAADPIERVSSRPDFLILGYPWLEATQLGPNGRSPYCDFAGARGAPACNPRDYARFAPLAQVSEKAPPTFIYHTTDDELVPVAGSVRFYQALVARHVPAELHAFESGRHGSGLGGATPALSRWPELLDGWLRARGLLDAGPSRPGS
jgi:acetyl esterase/lipase